MTAPVAAATYYSSRPIVSIAGRDQTELADTLVSLVVEDTIEGLFRCEARFGNLGLRNGSMQFLWFDRALLDFGADIAITLGPPGNSAQVFKGKITGLEAEYPATRPPEFAVLAEDALQDLRMTRRTRVFDQASDGDVARQIAQDHGLTPQVDHDGPTYTLLTQVNQSDLAFLRDRARASDALVTVDDRTLNFQARSRATTKSVTLTYGVDLRELTVLADLAHQRTKVRVTGWDVSSKQAIASEADDAAISSEMGSLTGGGSILQQKFADRVEQAAHLVPFSDSEGDALAQSRYRELARRFVSGVAHADGDPRVKVGTIVELKGLGDMFEGEYAVVAVRHTFDAARGYRTTFDIQRPGIGS